MDVNKLCFGCMKEKENPGQRCPYCGFDLNEYMQNCSARALRPGTILNGQYLVGKVLGEGGFGITYLAYDLNMLFPVAIKEYFPVGLAVRDVSERLTNRLTSFTGEKAEFYSRGMESFVEEARKLIQFRDYDGIVKVNTLFYENGTAYMVMEYICGKSLKKYLQEKKVPLSEAETLKIMTPVLQILGRVHEKGIIHRDISPDNIMLGDNGKVYLIDFGSARMITGAETKSLEVMLKPGYTPFEQYYSRGKMGPWTDVYAVCATMYRMMSGRVPQESAARVDEDFVKTLSALAKENVISPVSEHISNVVEKGMSVKREERYQDMKTLLGELTKKENSLSECGESIKENNRQENNIQEKNSTEYFGNPKRITRKKYLVVGIFAAAFGLFILIYCSLIMGKRDVDKADTFVKNESEDDLSTPVNSNEKNTVAPIATPTDECQVPESTDGAAEQASPEKQAIDRFLDDNGITKEQLAYCVMPLQSGVTKDSFRNFDNLNGQTRADFGKMYIAEAVYQRLSEGTIYNGTEGERDSNFLKTHLLEMLGREDENAEMKEDFLKHSSKEAAKSLVGLLGYFDESHENPYENPLLEGDWENGYTEMQNYFDKNGFADTIMTGDDKVFHCQTTVQDGMEFFRKMVVEGQESGQDPYKKNFRNLFHRPAIDKPDTSCSAVARNMLALSEKNGKHCCWMSEKAGQAEDGSGEACEETFLAVVNDIYDSEASGFVLYTRIDESVISDEQQEQFVQKVYDVMTGGVSEKMTDTELNG